MEKTQNRKQPKPKACPMGAKTGRPSSWDPNLADEIVKTIEREPKGLNQLCAENEHWPNPSTIYGWTYDHDDFSKKYWCAKVNQATIYVDDLQNIMHEVKENPSLTGWGKLTLQHRHWYAARLVPKIFGDRQKLENLEELNIEKDREIAILKEHLKKYEREY